MVAVGALAALVPSARAGERVSLSNGFEMRCDHHARVGEGVRLYLSAGEDDYIELRPEEIASFARVTDMPATAAGNFESKSPRDARLSSEDLGEMLAEAGRTHDLDVDLLASVVKAESGGQARAVSRAGARGLMQLMPATAAGLGVEDSFKPEENVRGGSAYLDALLTRYKDKLALALAAYNAGPGAVDHYGGIPPYRETQAYVARVIHEFNRRVRAREAEAGRAGAATAAPRNAASR